MQVAVQSIVVHERVRKEIGDLTRLMESMKDHGQLNPITITRANELVAGHRRLLSAQKLGWEYIDANVVERDSEVEKLELQLEENVHRKDFSPEELLDGYRKLEKLRRPGVWRRVGGFFRGLFSRIFRRNKRTRPQSPQPIAASGADTGMLSDGF